MGTKVGDYMNKIYCNRETDMVEQIINIDIDTRWDENWFPSCYVIDDIDNKISTYNMKYNNETEEFELVEGIPAKDEVIVIKQPTAEEIQEIKKENEDLKARLEKVENILLNSI